MSPGRRSPYDDAVLARTAEEERLRRLIGDRLRQARQRRGLSLHGVQEMSGGLWPAVMLGSYERGDRAVTAARLPLLADLYQVPVASLLPGASPEAERAGAFDLVIDHLVAVARGLRGDTEVPS